MPERLHREQTRRVEHHLVGSKQGNVVATQNLWNEAGHLLSHAGGHPKPGRLPT
jgi:hypothetical protein